MPTVRVLSESSALVASSVAAKAGVPAWDRALFRRINSLPDSLAPVVWAPMQAGALGAPLVVGSVLALRGDLRGGVRTAATGALAWGAAKALKRLVGRGRPGDHIDDTTLRMGSADNGLGYPSGHAAVVMTLIAAIPPGAHPLWRATGAALALTVGLSRIYVGAHYPLDVVGGWALGATIADAYASVEALAAHS